MGKSSTSPSQINVVSIEIVVLTVLGLFYTGRFQALPAMETTGSAT